MQDEDKVGFKKPPIGTRFEPGQSGNPRGRPAGSRSRKSIIEKFAAEKQTVLIAGQRRRLTTLEIVLFKLKTIALSGNPAAMEFSEQIQSKYDPEAETDEKRGYLLVQETMTPEEAIAEGEKANEEARARRETEARKKVPAEKSGS